MKLQTRQKCMPCAGTDSGRFYVEPDYIEVMGTKQITAYDTLHGKATAAVRITRSQLERALEAMEDGQ
ncbi:hypothetical protein LCGC14_2879990 [marine sediment metagenome]|uniref:Uncharacterized protein n=1 Tax=marine sediment metagenome TaxID=412755 RepID=A0A0F9A8B3_9ZZZZ